MSRLNKPKYGPSSPLSAEIVARLRGNGLTTKAIADLIHQSIYTVGELARKVGATRSTHDSKWRIR